MGVDGLRALISILGDFLFVSLVYSKRKVVCGGRWMELLTLEEVPSH